MFDVLQKFVLLTASVACVVLIIWSVTRLAHEFNQRLKKYRGRKLVRKARGLGPQLYTNKVGNSIGVCSAQDFKSVADWDKDAKPWEPRRRVKVRPTFVFCRDDSLRSRMHVDASADEVETLVVDLVEKLTGYSFKQVDSPSFSRAVKLIAPSNPQLFVPFAESTPEEEGRRLMEFYGNTPYFYQIRDYLLRP